MLNTILSTVDAETLRTLVPWTGWIVVILGLLSKVPGVVDNVDKWNAKVLMPLAHRLKSDSLRRAAIKADIRGHINDAVRQIAPQMPDGWIGDIDIKWLNNETRNAFFERDKLVVHMRPYADQERNFVSVLNIFLKETLFGNVSQLIPPLQRSAAELLVGDRIASLRGATTASAFGQYIFEPAVKNAKVEKYYHRYDSLDTRGFFSGPFLREIKHVAEEVRASRKKTEMSSEMNAALVHLEEFISGLDRKYTKNVAMPLDAWLREGIMTKYGLLLVAHPSKAASEDSAGYLARVRDYHSRGVTRLYVLGTANEQQFASRVISEIDRSSAYAIEQRFALYRDYRGNPGGFGAVFCLRTD